MNEVIQPVIELKDRLMPYGTLYESFVYPVKSMAGIATPQIGVDEYGLMGDRRRVFSKLESNANNAKAHLTNRDRGANDMLLFQPQFIDPANPNGSDIIVKSPAGKIFGFEDEELKKLLEEKSGQKLVRRYYKGGFPDNHRISIIGMPSVRRLEQELDIPVDHRRFRANFYINFPEGYFPEESPNGLLIRIGRGETAPIIAIQSAINRCMMVNIDPQTAETDARILKHIAQQHDNRFGLYGAVIRPGIANIGDQVGALKLI